CRLRVDADLFNKMAAGEANALAALLRGALAVDGDLELMMLFQRLLPGGRAAKAMVREGTPRRERRAQPGHSMSALTGRRRASPSSEWRSAPRRSGGGCRARRGAPAPR